MTTPSYPRVGAQFFANRFLVYALRTGVNMDHGSQAFALLAAVALTEDRTRYTKGVKFWNDNLTAYLGCREDRLSDVRRRLVNAGWLHYEPGRKGIAGQYWVLVPGGDSKIDDTVLGANNPPENPGDNPEHDDDFPHGKTGGNPGDNATEEDFPPGKAQGKGSDEPNFPPGIPCDNAGDNAGDKPVPFIPKPKPKPYGSKTAFLELSFLLKDGSAWILSAEKFAEYETTFPAVDVPAELRVARQWCLDNPPKRKTAAGMPRFLTSWLGRKRTEPSKAGTKSPASPGSGFAAIEADILRDTGKLLDWLDAQQAVDASHENQIWTIAAAEQALAEGQKPAAWFVDLMKGVAIGDRSKFKDDFYDRAKLRLRAWNARDQLQHDQRDQPRGPHSIAEIRQGVAT